MIRFKAYLNENFEDNYKDVRTTAETIARKVGSFVDKKVIGKKPIEPISGLRDYGVLFDLDEVDPSFPHIHIALTVGTPATSASGFALDNEQTETYMNFPCIRLDKATLSHLNMLAVSDFYELVKRLRTVEYEFKYNEFISTFVHEFTHYIDHIRGHMKGEVGGPRQPGGNKPLDAGTYERIYYNIGTELNAFTDQMIDQFDRFFRNNAVEVNNMQDMIHTIKFTLSHSNLFQKLFVYATPRNKHRVMKRLADYFHRVVEPTIEKRNRITRSATKYNMPSQRGWSLSKRKEYKGSHLNV